MKIDITEIMHSYRRRLVMVIVLTFLLLISSQVVVMATVSVRGAEIGDIRRQQEEIRLANELLRSQINGAKTLETITTEVNDRFEMRTVKPEVISTQSTEVVANN